jgi:hypothetical protein
MMTRRASLIALAGIVAGVASIGIGSVSAQATKSGIEAKAKEGATKARMDWQSLPAEQQQKLREEWKMDAEKAQQKWNALTPEQQDAEKQKVAAVADKAQKKWQSLPK